MEIMKMETISWSPKIRQAKIRQLYQNDALGVVDEILVEERFRYDDGWRSDAGILVGAG